MVIEDDGGWIQEESVLDAATARKVNPAGQQPLHLWPGEAFAQIVTHVGFLKVRSRTCVVYTVQSRTSLNRPSTAPNKSFSRNTRFQSSS